MRKDSSKVKMQVIPQCDFNYFIWYKSDFEAFEWNLIKNPQEGDVIPGLSGLRKTRLKAMNKGKSGGFRVDYLDIPEKGKLYFIVLYPKNVKEDLFPEEKRMIARLVKQLKEEANHG